MTRSAIICFGSILIGLLLTGQSYAQIDDETILGAWLLDEGAGDVAADASGNGHDGTLLGSPDWVAGRFGMALAFNGSSAYVDCGNPAAFNVDVFSVSFWCNIPSSQGWNHMISRGSHVASGTPGSVNWGVMMYDAQETILYETFNDTGWVGINTAAPAGEWHHIVATLDETAMELYIDGELAATASGGVLLDESRPFVIGARSDAGAAGGFFDGSLDEVGYFNAILTPDDISDIMNKGLEEVVGGPPVAGKPQPAHAQIDVSRDPVLSWTAGKLAATHNVYFSDSLDEVSSGAASALIGDGITETSVEPGRLAYESTYYWRVDEVNSAPDFAVFEGAVWSFTVEPLAYPIEGVIATSSSVADAGEGPENTVNGSGLNANDEHSVEASDMWLVTPGAEPLWIQYEFDQVYKLYEMLVWNYNVQFEAILGFGIKDVTVEYSDNGTDWMVLGDVELTQGPAAAGYAANTTIDLQGIAARYVRLAVHSGWGMLGQFGLSEVRFLFTPVTPREPQPATGAANVGIDAVLSWRAGREAGVHEVYLGTDEAAVADGTALADSVSASRYQPSALEFGSTYYWKIREVNDIEATPAWEGSVWTFSTLEFTLIEDFESYDDEDNVIYEAWVDGWTNETGSTVGYLEAPFAERSIVHGGAQSMPLEYDNSVGPFYSEAEHDLGGLNLTVGGADTLRLFVGGQTPAFQEGADGTIFMNGIGADIWGTADEFRYAYKNLSGDGSMVARVDSLADSDVWAKGGVMIRETLEPGSPFAAVYMTGDNGVRYQARLATDVDAVSDSDVATAEQIALREPVWVKIERVGNACNGYYSTDGENWTAMAWNPQTIDMAGDVTIGLALTSHSSSASTGAAFAGVSDSGGVSGSWQMAEVGVAQPAGGNEPEDIYVALEDSAGHVAAVTHANATALPAWQQWLIPLSEFTGVNLNSVKTLYIGIGDRDNPTAGSSGLLFIDDIGFGKPLR